MPVTKAANETHADCVRIITRAEMRMADEIDRGQAAGEIAGRGNPQGSGVSTMGDLGIDNRRVAEWRELRDAGEEVVETAITTALAEGRAPTKKEILDTAKGIRAERAVMGSIDIDPASSAIRMSRLMANLRRMPTRFLIEFRQFS